MPSSSSPPSIRIIAKHAGVSRQTVSAILGDKAHLYAADTRSRVLDAAMELGYRPNLAARDMIQGRLGAIGMLVSEEGEVSALNHMIEGIYTALTRLNLALRVCTIPSLDYSQQDSIHALLQNLPVDGLLVNYTHRCPPELESILDRFNIPAVWLNTKRAVNCVRPDDAGAGAAGVQCLHSLNHRNIGYLTNKPTPEKHYSLFDRQSGYQQAMEQHGLSPNVLQLEKEDCKHEALPAIEAWLDAAPGLTAVLTQSRAEANLLFAAAYRRGCRVPGNLSILAMETETTGNIGIDVDQILIPTQQVGARSLEVLHQLIEGVADQFPEEVLPALIPDETDLGYSCCRLL